MGAARFEMWVLLKLIAIGEFIASAVMLYLLYIETSGMARVQVITIYGFISITFAWLGSRSIRLAHKRYKRFYKPTEDH